MDYVQQGRVSMEFHSHNEAETEAIGARLAAVLYPRSPEGQAMLQIPPC